jgi:hypothetical protein
MKRQALLIGSPGTQGTKSYLKGVEKDLVAYNAFLQSSLGGSWESHEIQILRSPSRLAVESALQTLSAHDYSFVLFGGHGYHDSSKSKTMIELQPNVELEADVLKRGAASHTLMLDCCRVETKPVRLLLDSLAKAEGFAPRLTRSECRRYFDQAVARAARGLVVLHACSIGEKAGESEQDGGYYSSSLIDVSNRWHRDSTTDTSTKFSTLSVVDAHERAVSAVETLSGGRQKPTLEKPRAENYFPLAVIA